MLDDIIFYDIIITDHIIIIITYHIIIILNTITFK